MLKTLFAYIGAIHLLVDIAVLGLVWWWGYEARQTKNEDDNYVGHDEEAGPKDQ